MNIKKATLDDIRQIEILYELLFEKMASLQPNYIKPAKQDITFITQSITEDMSDIIVAEKDNNIAGFLLIQSLQTPPYNCVVQHKYAFITDIIVDDQYQKLGIGSALLQVAKQWAEERQLDYVELNVLVENSGAIALYEKQGFTDKVHTMRYEL